MARNILLVIHPTREDASVFAAELAPELLKYGLAAYSNSSKRMNGVEPYSPSEKYEIAIVLGGDGTMLRAAELVRNTETPILGINLGNVGFLAEIEMPSAATLAQAVFERRYRGEPRLVLEFEATRGGSELARGWALNELAIERSNAQMVELFVQIDDRPLSRWGCDGVICATPTGSTAYAFSAGGPVLWPQLDAMVVLPLAAHALYSRPMVISPNSTVVVDIESKEAVISADGMRHVQLQSGDRLAVRRASYTITILHIEAAVFTDRLVAKFKLPIEGWRGISSSTSTSKR